MFDLVRDVGIEFSKVYSRWIDTCREGRDVGTGEIRKFLVSVGWIWGHGSE
jgi:hypothetical protein